MGGVRGKGSGETKTSTKKPNVFFFLLDDLGYGDIGYQSSDLGEMTPNLDALAAGGIKVHFFHAKERAILSSITVHTAQPFAP